MKYIREFIKKLPDSEFQKITASNFTNTELALIKYYKTEKEESPDSEISAKLKIKTSTLKKLQSKLLSKVLSFFVGDNFYDQMVFLSNTNCHKILLHLSKKEIKTLKNDNEIEKLKNLLVKIPFNILSAIVTVYSVKDLKKWEIEYLAIGKKNEKGFKKLQILNLILEIQQFDNWSSARMKKIKKRIDKISISKDDVELNFWYNKLLGDFNQFTDEEAYMNMIKANYELISDGKISLSSELEVNSKLQYCFYLIYQNEFQETYDYFKSLEKQYPSVIGSKRGLRYIDLISQICIVLGKYEEARNYIYNGYPIEQGKPGKFSEIFFGNTTILAMLDVLEKNFELAYQRIQAAKTGLKKQYFIFLDSLLRITEQAYYLKIADYDYADTLYQKNIKFYQYHKNEGLETMFNAHKILNTYAKIIFDKKQLSKKETEYLSELNVGDFAFIGHFIEKLNPNS